jgi:hypothetical protein
VHQSSYGGLTSPTGQSSAKPQPSGSKYSDYKANSNQKPPISANSAISLKSSFNNNPEAAPHHDPEHTADFDRAYLKLVGKYSREAGGDLLIPGTDMYRYETAKKFNPKEVQEKIDQFEEKKR